MTSTLNYIREHLNELMRHGQSTSSHVEDKAPLRKWKDTVRTDDDIKMVRRYVRLGTRIGIPPTMSVRTGRGRNGVPVFEYVNNPDFMTFARDASKFTTPGQTNAYNIRGRRMFTSLDDGTYWKTSNSRGAIVPVPADPRLAKVKAFLRRHLGREPSDKQIDTFIYFYFGSDRFEDPYSNGYGGHLFYGIQDGHYYDSGRHFYRDTRNNDNFYPLIRRIQRRINRVGMNGRIEYHFEEGNGNNSNSNSNSNSNTSVREARIRAQNVRRQREQVGYARNKNSMNANKKTNNTSNRIKWEQHEVKNLPEDPVSLHNFSNGEKAVKIKRQYYTPQSFRSQATMSMTSAYNKNGNTVLFKNPVSRNNVRRADVEFVILKKKV